VAWDDALALAAFSRAARAVVVQGCFVGKDFHKASGIMGSRAFAVNEGDKMSEGPERLHNVEVHTNEIGNWQGVNGNLKVWWIGTGHIGFSGSSAVSSEEGCLVDGEIAADAGAVCGVGCRFSRRGKRGHRIIINLNMRWASQGE